jgi:hypothetical protein
MDPFKYRVTTRLESPLLKSPLPNVSSREIAAALRRSAADRLRASSVRGRVFALKQPRFVSVRCFG